MEDSSLSVQSATGDVSRLRSDSVIRFELGKLSGVTIDHAYATVVQKKEPEVTLFETDDGFQDFEEFFAQVTGKKYWECVPQAVFAKEVTIVLPLVGNDGQR